MYHSLSVLRAARRHLEQAPMARTVALARACGVSRAALVRAVHDETGLSVQRWQDMLRLERVAALLNDHRPQSLKEVSAELGFATQQGFSRWLKRASGLTPTAYRQQTAARADAGGGNATRLRTGTATPGHSIEP